MTLDPIAIATSGYVCNGSPVPVAIATHGYVCVAVPRAVISIGGGSGGIAKRETEILEAVALAIIAIENYYG